MHSQVVGVACIVQNIKEESLFRRNEEDSDHEEEIQVDYYGCTDCLYSSRLLFVMRDHVNRHNKVLLDSKEFSCYEQKLGMYSCQDCNFKTMFTVNFKMHVKLNHGKNEDKGKGNLTVPFNQADVWKFYNCKQCGFSTYSIMVLLKHYHTQCVKEVEMINELSFKKIQNLSTKKIAVTCGTKTTNRNKSRKCLITKCVQQKKLMNSILLKRKIWTCGLCTFVSTESHILKRHEMQIHRYEVFDRKSYFNILERFFLFGYLDNKDLPHKNIQKELVNVHEEDKQDSIYTCQKCSYKTFTKSNLENHMVRLDHHADVNYTFENIKYKTYYCDKCSYKTLKKDLLKTHIISNHIEVKPSDLFKCNHCHYQTKVKRYLNTHIHKCHKRNNKSLHCDRCSYSTRWKVDLKWHMLAKHTHPDDIQWFQCSDCSFRAVQERLLRAHIQRTHMPDAGVWFKCNHCVYKARRQATLAKHMDVCH